MTFPNGARPYSEVEVRIINYAAFIDYLVYLIVPDEWDYIRRCHKWTLVKRIHQLSQQYQLFSEPEQLIETIKVYRNKLAHPRRQFTHQELTDAHNLLATAINEFFSNENIPDWLKSEYQATWAEGRIPIKREQFWDNAWAAMRVLRERDNEMSDLHDKSDYQNLYCGYLISSGFDPQVDTDGHVTFQYNGRTCRITVIPADPQYFCIDSHESIKGDGELVIAYKVANRVTAKAKVAKVYVTEDGNYVVASIEVFLDKPSSFQSIFERCLKELHNAVNEFEKAMQEMKPTPSSPPGRERGGRQVRTSRY